MQGIGMIGTVYDCAGEYDFIHSETMAKKRKEQNTVPVAKMIELWDKILKLEWMNDHSAAVAVGISGGTVNSWRNGGVENVNADMVRRIEKRLGYRIRLGDSGEWAISKVGENIVHKQAVPDINGLLAETDDGDWGKIRSYLLHHDLDSLDKVKRLLQRCEELEALYMSFEDHARKIKLRDKNNER